MSVPLLPSWRRGTTRDTLLGFLRAARDVPVEHRVACFDNDGTLWCERPTYAQFDFFVDALKSAVRSDPQLATRAEFAALIAGDRAAVGEIGLQRIAHALTGLFKGQSPEEFTAHARRFMAGAHHATLGRPLRRCVYQPMVELVAELHRLDFTVSVVTGGGTEFVRAISEELYGVPSQNVVGTLIAYELVPATSDSGPSLRRTDALVGGANEGAVKVSNIQTQLGRRPILAAGNSGGDREMLEWATSGDHPSLALVVDHDDAEREFAYASSAATFADPEPITAVSARLGWLTISMAKDWSTVFPSWSGHA